MDETLTERLADAEARLTQVEAEVALLRRARTTKPGPGFRVAATVDVLRESGKEMNVEEIAAALETRGWDVGRNSVAAELSYLVRVRRVRRVRRGIYAALRGEE